MTVQNKYDSELAVAKVVQHLFMMRSSVRTESVHIWFQCTKRTTDVAYRMKLRQSNATHATVRSSCIQGPVFGIVSCFVFQPKYVSVYVLSSFCYTKLNHSSKDPTTWQFSLRTPVLFQFVYPLPQTRS